MALAQAEPKGGTHEVFHNPVRYRRPIDVRRRCVCIGGSIEIITH